MTHRFVVIGSNSFSGSHFIQHLLQENYEVIGVSRSEELHSVFLPYRWGKTELINYRFYQMDLNHDLQALMQIIKDFQPEYVVNFAAQGMVAQSWQTPEHWYQTNVVGQVQFHDQLRKCSFLKKYVHVTTPEAYGSMEGWTKEHFHFAPSTPYAVSRASCDLHLMSFFKAYHFPVVFTRAANVYGPGQQLYRIIPRTMLFARLGKKLPLHGGGHSVRSFIHIKDVADATLRVAQHGVSGETYHISTRETVSIRGLVEQICVSMGKKFEEVVEVSEDRLGKDEAYLLDSQKIRNDLGWAEQFSLEEGILHTLEWLDNNLEILQEQPDSYIHKP
jgi:dTDP-glucose 4,6-dehydratase